MTICLEQSSLELFCGSLHAGDRSLVRESPHYCFRIEFSSSVQVKVGVHTAEGMGTNKKVAKRNAAENMLEILGFKVPQPQPPKPALKTEEKVSPEEAAAG